MDTPLDIAQLRCDFPILERKVGKYPLVYLDNTATTQTPRQVVEAIERMYYRHKANVHRGVHTLSQEATDLQERARERVRSFINARSTSEIIFTRGTTEAINLVASSFGSMMEDGAEIILTVMEHHANIVPWQLLQRWRQVKLVPIGLHPDGSLDMDALTEAMCERTRLVTVCHVSNVLGTVNPVADIIREAHSRGIPVLIDGAQAIGHMKVDVRALDADFYVFSAHKMYGPAGVGVLYGRESLLEKMPPYQGGGEMIGNVSFEKTTFADLPYKFEAGTPDFVDIAALHTAVDWLEGVGIEAVHAHEQELLEYATARMMEIPGMRIFGNAPGKAPIISFLVGDIHQYDLGMLLDKLGVAVRTGHHCAEPLMHYLGIEGCVRASFALYNTRDEADALLSALHRVIPMLS
ncbi:MAG: cysteine desulfurase [Candidatus Amulumruptor caecigallinarius]|nr:cysteine desulfurase [Candidatus Amulumruptor caecigallinarius]MCM1397088.1 cysteine desulfurase [Candidatus Amulumruptor caecigallinarius]MCM1454074.1 cysteine desulfurase [bacterium]